MPVMAPPPRTIHAAPGCNVSTRAGRLQHQHHLAVAAAARQREWRRPAAVGELGARAGGASAKLTTSRYDGTALIAAAHLGHDGVVRQLIKAGAPLDHVNNLHWTALIEAVVLGDGGARHQATVRALLAAGADRTLTDRHGRTALELARERGYAAMVTMLEGATR